MNTLMDTKEIKLQAKINLRHMNKNDDTLIPGEAIMSKIYLLTEEETNMMVSHFAISSKKQLGGYLPYVFTEHGLLMLANVIKSERAIKMSIRIIEIFIKLREMMIAHNDIYLRLDKIENILTFQDDQIRSIIDYLKELEKIKKQEMDLEQRKRIGFKS